MPLISASGLTRYYGGYEIFRNVGFTLEPGQRVGLVGPNGGGKSSLLRIVVGEEEQNHGQIDYQTGLRIGYQPQTPPEAPTGTLWDHLETVFANVMALEKELDELSHRLGEPNCPESVMNSYSDVQHAFEIAGGYTYRNTLETILTGLGFHPGDFNRPVAEFSGGWRTRAALARLLLTSPDLLVLDEPTNHLDLDSVKWLETYLGTYKGTLLIVSHDRFFLDKVTTDTWELDFKTIETYPGGYSKYVKLRAARYAERKKQYEAQQQFIAETEDFIRRNIAGQRSAEAKGRRKRLERFIEEEAIPNPPEHRELHCKFMTVPRSGDIVLRVKEFQIGYPGSVKPLATIGFLEVERGQRFAILGPNGCGKSTFLKSLVGELKPLGGVATFGANVKIAYFSQTHEDLDLSMNILDTLRSAWPGSTEQQCRTLLGSMLFSGDDVFKAVGVLSGGQRSRVALAKLSVSGANLLILDEPTNHLDIPTQEVLQELLQSFTGTMLLVSHDRYLVDALNPEILVLADSKLTLLQGGWRAYAGPEDASPGAREAAKEKEQARKADKAEAKADARSEAKAAASSAGASKGGGDKSKDNKGGSGGGKAKAAAPVLSYDEQKAQRSEMRKHRQAYERTEKQIADLELKKKALEIEIGKAGEAADIAKVRKLSFDHGQLEGEMATLLERWAELADLLESAAE